MLSLYWARDIFIGGADLFELDFATYMNDSIFFILALLAVYSLIGTIQGTREYYLVQKRLTRYHALVRQLERINERAQKSAEEKAAAQAQEEAPARPTRPRTTPISAPIAALISDDEPETSHTRRITPLEENHTRRIPNFDETPPRPNEPNPNDTRLEETRRVPRTPLVPEDTAPLIYKNPFPTQRSKSEPDGTNTDNP